jgi:hypothetical protein
MEAVRPWTIRQIACRCLRYRVIIMALSGTHYWGGWLN